MQVETICTFKNYLYIVTSGFFSQNKVEKIGVIYWGLVGYEMIDSQLGATRLVGYLSSHIQRALVE